MRSVFYFSDEDTDLNSLIKSWLRNQPEECRQNLENWIGDYFEKALNWVLKQVNNSRLLIISIFIHLFYLSCFLKFVITLISENVNIFMGSNIEKVTHS